MKAKIMKPAAILFALTCLVIGTNYSTPVESASSAVNSVVTAKVFICGGPYATKFHSHSKCRGLNNCSADIYSYPSQSSAQSAGYEHCKICWK